jgi:hypothetical protein
VCWIALHAQQYDRQHRSVTMVTMWHHFYTHFNCNILHIFAENFILKINLLKYVDSFIIVHPTNPKHLSVVTDCFRHRLLQIRWCPNYITDDIILVLINYSCWGGNQLFFKNHIIHCINTSLSIKDIVSTTKTPELYIELDCLLIYW